MNLPTILIAIVIAGIFIAIVARSVHNKKLGKSSCSCGGNCATCGACHSQK